MENIDLSTILNEDPIDDVSQNLLRRGSFVEALYNEIIKLPVTNSFCFGLYGSWGEGKSSVLHLLRNKLKKTFKIILFEFDPWYLATKEAILKNFLEGLERALRPSFPRKSRKILQKYFRKLSLGVSVLGTGAQIGFEFEKEGLLELKNEINSQIEMTKKTLVIIIDDIDRLETDEILLVFKLVKLITNFKNTVFVLSFDPKAVENSFQNKNIDVDYIEKIVQKPIPLPKIEQADIDQFLDLALELAFSQLHVDKSRVNIELEEYFPLIYQRHANKFFTTLRSVKRYVNSLCSSLPPVVHEVNLYDFLLLEIIKVFAPRIYTDIYENWQFYVPQRTSNERWLNPLELKNGQEKETIVKEHIEQLLQSEPQKEVFTNLLDSLFPHFSSEEDARREKRIYSTSFLKYFTLRVPSRELSDESIEREISSWNSNRLSTDKLWERLLQYKRDGKLSELLDKLVVFMDLVDQRTAQELIRCTYRNSSSFQKDKTVFLLLNEWDRARRLVFFLINKKLENERILSTLEEVMHESDTLDFATTIYISCTKKGNRLFPTDDLADTNKNKLRHILIERFEKAFIKGGQDFFKSSEPIYVLFRLWDLCAEEEKTTLKECRVSKYIEDKLKEKPEYIGKLLNSFVSRSIDEEKPSIRGFPISEAEKYLDIDEIYSKIRNENRVFYSTDQEKEAVQLFCKAYEESKEKSS